MTTEEKLLELYKMLHDGGFPEFVAHAIQDVLTKNTCADTFVDSLYAHVKNEIELLKIYGNYARTN